MVIAVEAYAGSGGDGVRIEEMLVVTKDGNRLVTKFSSKHLISCSLVGTIYP
jgi:Xaa-Pro aminopeptidase